MDVFIQTATEEWHNIDYSQGISPSPRDSHILVNSSNSIFLFGGSTGNPRSDFYEYKIDEAKWSCVSHNGGNIPNSRFCHVGVVVRKKFYIFGGYDGDSRLNDFHYFMIDDNTSDIPKGSLVKDLTSFINNEKFSDV